MGISSEQALEAVATLSTLLEETSSVVNVLGSTPIRGSIFEREVRESPSALSIKTAHSQAYILLESSADCISGFTMTLSPPVNTISPWVLTRAALEACASSIYIGRPDISITDRIARSLAFRLYGLREQRKISFDAGEDTSGIESRMDALAATADTFSIPLQRNTAGTLRQIGERWPGYTDLVSNELDQRIAYRIMSGVAHSLPPILQQLSFRTIGASIEDKDLVNAEKSISPQSIIFACTKLSFAFLRALGAVLRVKGALVLDTIRLLRRHSDEMRLPEAEFRKCIWTEL